MIMTTIAAKSSPSSAILRTIERVRERDITTFQKGDDENERVKGREDTHTFEQKLRGEQVILYLSTYSTRYFVTSCDVFLISLC
jgi:hypothetical protein